MSNPRRRVYPQGDPNAPPTPDLPQQFGAMNLQTNPGPGQNTAPYTPAAPNTPATSYTPAAPNTFVQPHVATTPGVPGAFNPAATPNYPAAPFNNTPTTTPNVYNTPQPTQPQFSAESQAPAKLMRMTVNCIPKTMEILNKSSIPVGCVIQPLSDEYKEPVPLIDFGTIGIVRCHICRAYMNPFMQWSKGGQSFICNLCGRANDTPAGYFSPLDPQTGRRADYPSRPELSSGVVDLVAPGEYMVRPPMPPSYIFVIDVSYYNVHSGGLQYVTHAIKHVLQLATEQTEAAIPLSDPRTKVAIITYDSSIHFYNLKQGLSQPQMLCVSDLTEAFVPQGLDLLVNLHDSKQVIDTLLTRLPQMFAQSQNVQACLGPAVKAAMTVARHLGGKVLLFTAQLPSIGVGKLAARFDVKSLAPDSATLSGSDRETQLFKPQTEFYKNLALECSKLQIGVDLFLLTPQYHDVTSLAPLAHLTGGQLYYYPEFQLPRDGNQLIEDVRHNLVRTTGWEGVMRVRCSKGVKVQAYHGAFFLRSSDLLALPSVDCDKAFGVQLTLQENLSTSYNFIQAALLYTTSTSERRIRVLNMCLPTTSNLQDMFNLADGEAVAALLIKMAIDRALQAKVSDAREALVNKVVDILASYRQTLGTGQASAQLLLPATLTSLPLHILAMIKHPVLRAYQDVSPDLRAYHMQRLRSLSSSRTLLALYPHLYALHTLTDEAPAVLTLSSEKLDRQGAFLLDNGEVLLLWIGKAISIEYLQQVFGLSSLDGVDPATIQINKETPLGARVSQLIESLRADKGIYQPLCVLRDGEPSAMRFLSYFVEDRTKTLYSYYEFLMQLQKQVAAKFTR